MIMTIFRPSKKDIAIVILSINLVFSFNALQIMIRGGIITPCYIYGPK